MRRTCPKCNGKVRGDGRCRRCEAREKSTSAVSQQKQRHEQVLATPSDRIDSDLREAMLEWNVLCVVTADPRERSCLELGRVIASLLSSQSAFSQYGARWLDDAVNPTLARAIALHGAAHPVLQRASALRDQVAARLAPAHAPPVEPPRPAPSPPPAAAPPVQPVVEKPAPAPIAPAHTAEEIERRVREILSRCSGDMYSARFRSPADIRPQTRMEDLFDHWDYFRNEVLQHIEDEFHVLFPVEFEDKVWNTVGEVERFVTAALEFQARAGPPDVAAARAAVESDILTGVRAYLLDARTTLCWRTVKLPIEEWAWVSGACAKRLRDQLRRKLPKWSVQIDNIAGRFYGQVKLNCRFYERGDSYHYELLARLDGQTPGLALHAVYDYWKPPDGRCHTVNLRLSYEHPSRSGRAALGGGCLWGVLLGLAGVGGLWALVTYAHVTWAPTLSTPRWLPVSDSSWLNVLASGAEICGVAGLAVALLSWIRCTLWNASLRRKWDRAADQRSLLEQTFAELDLAAALGVPLFESPSEFTRRG